MKNFLLSLLFVGAFLGTTQAQLNDYKYIIIPKKFDGFKKENQHQTSTLAKFLLSQKGFNAVYEHALPQDLNANRCLGLLAHLRNDSSLFATRVALVLKDCAGQEVFSTKLGTSRLKDYKSSYKEALTNAFESFDDITYEYKASSQSTEPVSVSYKNDVKNVDKKEIEQEPKMDQKQEVVVEQKATPDEQSYKSLEPAPSEIKKAEPAKEKIIPEVKSEEEMDVWYAQELQNGYQLVDGAPKIRLKLYKTSMLDVYLAENEKGNGVVYKKDAKWFFEYYNGTTLVIEELNIKF